MIIRVGIGQDSHRFVSRFSKKKCWLGGIAIPQQRGFKANSDGDVVIHAICNAISSLSGEIILGKLADEMCLKGIQDSTQYLERALQTLARQRIVHVALTIEARRPKLLSYIPLMRKKLAELMQLTEEQIGITATSGERLTAFGKALGVQVFCVITTQERRSL